MSSGIFLKYCIVPLCKSSSIDTPNKLFINVPLNVGMRHMWMTAARIPRWNRYSHVHFCEDHFEVEEDIENLTKYKLMGGQLLLKRGIVPRYFDCQKRSITRKKGPRKSYMSIVHKKTIESALSAATSSTQEPNTDGKCIEDTEESNDCKPIEFVTVDEEESQMKESDTNASTCSIPEPGSDLRVQSVKEIDDRMPIEYMTVGEEEPQVWMYEVLPTDTSANVQAYPNVSLIDKGGRTAPIAPSVQQGPANGAKRMMLAYMGEPQGDQEQPHRREETSERMRDALKEVAATNREVAAALKELAASTYLLATAQKRKAKADVVMAKIALGRAKKEGLM